LKKSFPFVFFGLVLTAVVPGACGPTHQLLVPTEITRPLLAKPPSPGPFGIGIAVVDFSFEPPEQPKVIGRDSDRVRQIVWEGNPGRLLADLVAEALLEQGESAFRVKEGVPTPDASNVVKGIVRRFEANIRRLSVINVQVEATVEITLFVSGQGEQAPWQTSITSNAVLRELIPLPDDVRKALSDAANSAADEAARRIREKGATGNKR